MLGLVALGLCCVVPAVALLVVYLRPKKRESKGYEANPEWPGPDWRDKTLQD